MLFANGKYKGKVVFHLSEPYLSILEATFHYFLSEDSVEIEENEMIVNCYQNEIDIVFDGLLFLEKYGEIESTFIISTYGVKNSHIVTLKNNSLHEYQAYVDYEKMEIRTYRYLLEKLGRETVKEYRILKNNLSGISDSYDFEILDVALENLYKGIYLKKSIEDIERFVERKIATVELFFEDKKILLDNVKENKWFDVEMKYQPNALRTTYNFLRKIEVDPNEKRKLNLDGFITYLYEPFMKLLVDKNKSDEKNVLINNITWNTPCSQCVFRIRKTTQGCNICKPKKT